MIERPNYLQDLISFKEKDLIKIVTGIRRCGKSTQFDLYIEYLLENVGGVHMDEITYDKVLDETNPKFKQLYWEQHLDYKSRWVKTF